MRLPQVRAPGLVSSTLSGASAASLSNMRLFVAEARSMSTVSSVDPRIHVFEPRKTATHICISRYTSGGEKRVKLRTFLFQTSDGLPFACVLAVLSSRFVLVLVLARGACARGFVCSSACRQLDELHAEGAAKDNMRLVHDGRERAAL